MSNLNTNFVALDNALFDRFTKKLYKSLTQDTELSLSKTKELASKSLGFRNYHGLQDYLNQPAVKLPLSSDKPGETQGYLIANTNNTNQSFLTRFSNENMISMASYLIKADDMWSERALLLLKTVLSLIDILKMEKNADNIRKHISFDVLFALYQKTENMKAKELILDYCTNMLPGFDPTRHTQNAAEQNSYLSVQLVPLIEFLKQVENEDFLMFSIDWLVTTNDKNEKLTLEKFRQLAQNKNLDPQENWNAFFTDGYQSVSANTDVHLYWYLKFNPKIILCEAYQDSWLCDSAFVTIMTSKLATQKYEKFYFSDFLVNISKVVNAEKKKAYMQLLQNIKYNYDSCVQYSAELYEHANAS